MLNNLSRTKWSFSDASRDRLRHRKAGRVLSKFRHCVDVNAKRWFVRHRIFAAPRARARQCRTGRWAVGADDLRRAAFLLGEPAAAGFVGVGLGELMKGCGLRGLASATAAFGVGNYAHTTVYHI